MAKNTVILFQGDSITDCGRNYEVSEDLGQGYAMMAASLLASSDSATNYTFYNRGISGHRAIDLKERWEEDCLELNPDVVSIMIGINDCWRRFDSGDPTSAEDFESYYRALLTPIKDKRLILIEPFVLPHPEDRLAWREDLDPKIQVVRKLAREFNATFLPLDGLFAAKMTDQPPAFWAEDGVHPTNAGHAFIATEWIKAYKKLGV